VGGASINDSIASLANGATAHFQVVVAIAKNVVAPNLANTATLTSPTPDPDGDGPTDRTTTITIPVTPPTPAVIAPINDVYVPSCTYFPLNYTGTFTDVSYGGPWTGTVNYGDGSGVKPLMVNGNQTFTLNHNYTMRAVYQVDVTLTNGFNLTSATSFWVGAHRDLPAAYGTLFTINDGNVQRSMITSITLSFGQHETLDAGAITFTTAAGQSAGFRTLTRDINGQTVVYVQFTDPTLIGGSLADGRYKLTVDGSKVHNQQGVAYNGGAVAVDSFFRLFGDVYGTGRVDNNDLIAMRSALRSMDGTAPYRWYLDYNQTCVVDAASYSAFLNRYGRSI
jgi:hypothetical protein